ncbi:SDR family NAD(P)-dependent oxidoreductase [Streptomyces fodineus]|uniref:SDR family NAD(P)-dependent oxidoreductase n=1 Tax=Streptomyces fodineus TaxID=1904616 RepID=UPI00131AA255|nr:SDR family NAD(P)-dependent oxidoreductase [Streptomyces fodineus]
MSGGSSTTGAEVAIRLAELGMDVAILDPAAEACAGVVGRIEDRGGRAMAIAADAADRGAVESALARVTSAWCEPSVLVNAVDATGGERLCDMSDARWEAATVRPLRGVFAASRLLADSMSEAGWGRVVTIAPPLADGAEHSTLRAGLEGFTRTIALELEAFGVTANLIAPRRPQVGLHSGGASDELPGGAARYARAVADAVSALLGAAAAAVTGQIVYVGADATD